MKLFESYNLRLKINKYEIFITGYDDYFKNKSRIKTQKSVKSGKLIKPIQCLICEKDKPLHAHHWNYLYPLDIIWCCFRCHFYLHKTATKIYIDDFQDNIDDYLIEEDKKQANTYAW